MSLSFIVCGILKIELYEFLVVKEIDIILIYLSAFNSSCCFKEIFSLLNSSN